MDHEEIEALLAGYALRSLSGEDAVVADRLLAEHVPGCFSCRGTLEAFQSVASDLALEPAPMDPPQTLLPQLHGELERVRRRRRVPLIAVAASVAALVGLSGLVVSQGVRLNTAKQRTALLGDYVNFAAQPGSRQVPLADRTGAPGPVTAAAHPGVQECYIVARDLPLPDAGTKYGIWLVRGSSVQLVGHFVPFEDTTVLRFAVDPSEFDQILVSQEPSDAASPGEVLWRATI